jgi:hypothetical protein
VSFAIIRLSVHTWSFCSGGNCVGSYPLLTEHHFAAVTITITPEDGRIRPKHVELFNTRNKVIHWLHQVGYSFTL